MAPSAAPCPGCSTPAPRTFRTTDRNHRVDPGLFDYHRCANCGTWFLHPVPGDLGRYYPRGYQVIPPSREVLAGWAEAERHKLEVLQAFCPGGRLCEIGPSTGAFVHLALQAGFAVDAIEMDPGCSGFLRRELGIPVSETTDAVAALAERRDYDAIALWHVIEHLPDPWATLEAARRSLRPGGILIVAAPNPQSLQFALLGGRWAHVDAPRHLQLIPMELLGRRLAEAGMALIHGTTDDPAARGWNRFGWEYSLMASFRGPRARWLAAAVGRKLAALLEHLERRPGRGSAYTMVFRRTR